MTPLHRSRLLRLVLAPVYGAAFCLFLPLIGFILLGEALLRALFKKNS